jgi:hypothetical protein
LTLSRTGGTHTEDTLGISLAVPQCAGLVLHAHSWVPLPIVGGLILRRAGFSGVLPFVVIVNTLGICRVVSFKIRGILGSYPST